MSVSAKTSWIANSKRLALEADALERKSTVRMDELKHEAVDLQRARNDSKQDTIKRVHGIRLALSDIQNRIKTNSWQSSNALKHQLETFESKLTAFKLLMRSQYDSLDQSCLTVENEINQLNSDMDSWDRALDDPEVSSVADPEAQKRIQQRGQQDLQRRAFIGAIDRKIAALGREGGWDPRDHDTFIRVWLMVFDSADYFEEQLAKLKIGENDPREDESVASHGEEDHNGDINGATGEDELTIPAGKRNIILKRMVTSVPWKSLEEIDEHINWYLKYLRLSLVKKRAVGEWKQEQLSARRQQQHDVLAADVLHPDEAAAADQSLNTSGMQDSNGEKKAPGSSEKDRAAVKERIAKWRAAQAKQLEDEKEAKAREAAAEARRQEEERRRKQVNLREQLGKWKEAETLNKELLGEVNAKLQRPKSVDPAALRRRQAKDLEAARLRSEKVDAANQKKVHREKAIMEAAVAVTGVPAERDPDRLLAGTKASERNKLTYEALDAAERRRNSLGAHGANIALSARDLQYAGRATPQWIKTARSGY